jgi:hypothetical protein
VFYIKNNFFLMRHLSVATSNWVLPCLSATIVLILQI